MRANGGIGDETAGTALAKAGGAAEGEAVVAEPFWP